MILPIALRYPRGPALPRHQTTTLLTANVRVEADSAALGAQPYR